MATRKRAQSGPRRSTTPGGARSRPRGGPTKGAKGSKGSNGTRRGWRRWLRIAGIAALVMAIVGALSALGLYSAIDVPNPNTAFQSQTTNVYYAGGKTKVGKFAEQNRESIDIDDIPQHMQDAAVSAEDRTFWTNEGIDVKGILRAALSNAQGNSRQGASTITQQYVKILYLTSEQTLTRKVKEAIVSLKLQNQQSKQSIMEGYLNTIYFGRGAYGIQAASRAYFKHPAKDLTVGESAVLASILNSPNNYDPTDGKATRKRLLQRYQYVLDGMVDMGTLKPGRRDRIYDKLPRFPKIKRGSTYGGQRGFMLELVRAELRAEGFDDATIDGGGLKVTTTFSKKAMDAMQSGVEEQRPDGPYNKLHIGAASVDVKTGALRAIYGGQDYLKSPYNWALNGGQPGSTFKAFAVAAALKDGFALSDTFDGNSPFEFPDGTSFRNQGDSSYGSAVSLTKATQDSINTAFIDLVDSMSGDGPQKVLDMAEKLGIPVKDTDLEPRADVALGGERVGVIDMVNAYSTIANEGVSHPWHVVSKVTRVSDSKVLFKAPREEKEALDPDIAADTSYALQQVVSAGSGRTALGLGRPAAGKTGTATNDKDQVSSSWFMGYTPQVATGVMYVRGDGNDQLDGWLPEYFGGAYPARTWTAIMQGIMDGVPVEDFPPPVFVDGDAPSDGHEPPPPPPETTAPAPEEDEEPSPEPRKSRSPRPSQPPSSEAPSPTTPTQPGGSPSLPGGDGNNGRGTGGNGGSGGNGGGGNGGRESREPLG